jgi:hypothetical protein
MSDAIRAMIDWCNEQGGINGRTVVGNYYDAKITEVNNVMTEACSQVFMLVGEGFALAGGGELVKGSGGDVSSHGEQATSAFLLWATAAKECGSALTRDCIMTELRKVHDWTAGGLHAAQDPGANMPGDCGMALKMEGTQFVQWAPTEPNAYGCDPSYVVRVNPPADAEAALSLDADRISQKNVS